MNEYNTIDESKLVQQCIRGNRSAQAELYNRYSKKMFGVCLGYTNNRDEAKDVLQDGFIKVFFGLKKYNGSGSLEGWIRKVMIHTAIDYYRRNLNNKNYVSIDDIRQIRLDACVLESISEQEILNLIQRLPEGARLIFNLYAVEGYKHEEIAEMLKITSGTSKSQLSRAKEMLKRWLLNLSLEKKPEEKTVQNIH